ncbi:MAG: energy-coupling factor ABC transporter ATP-binding protein, partial [Lachnospiraceae bacterium]|nr:energy-coupling factor ABC transporter ATP-binding protein [Lachnospiraceae bacterium]
EDIHRRENNITIFVSHNMNDIARMSDQVLVIHKGRLAMNGTPAEVFAREEELKSMGLALPDATEIVSQLRKKGMELPASCLTVDQAADAIANALGK